MIPQTLLNSSGVSRLRRPFLSDRFFNITVRLLERRRKLDDADFERLALSIRRARAEHPFFLTAWGAYSGARRARFRDDPGQHSEMKPVTDSDFKPVTF